MKFKVVSIHFTRECNFNCPFCYRRVERTIREKPRNFFIDLIKYLKKFTPQIALGGGEPLLDTEFVKNLGIECKNHNIILNLTTNGKQLLKMTKKEMQRILKNITMISISFDKFKWGNNIDEYAKVVKKIKTITDCEVGSNLLIDSTMFHKDGSLFAKIIIWLFKFAKVDRVFALYPKNTEFIDISQFNKIYRALTYHYPMFFVDDLTKQILEQGYNWKFPCHYGKLISIDEQGYISGCSFDNNKVLKLDDPSDILKIKDIKFKERYKCPFLKIPKEILSCY